MANSSFLALRKGKSGVSLRLPLFILLLVFDILIVVGGAWFALNYMKGLSKTQIARDNLAEVNRLETVLNEYDFLYPRKVYVMEPVPMAPTNWGITLGPSGGSYLSLIRHILKDDNEVFGGSYIFFDGYTKWDDSEGVVNLLGKGKLAGEVYEKLLGLWKEFEPKWGKELIALEDRIWDLRAKITSFAMEHESGLQEYFAKVRRLHNVDVNTAPYYVPGLIKARGTLVKLVEKRNNLLEVANQDIHKVEDWLKSKAPELKAEKKASVVNIILHRAVGPLIALAILLALSIGWHIFNAVNKNADFAIIFSSHLIYSIIALSIVFLIISAILLNASSIEDFYKIINFFGMKVVQPISS